MFLGIDLGTSGAKVLLLDRRHAVRASATAPLTVQQPQPLWREQHPADWWRAVETALDAVLADARAQGIAPGEVDGIGLSGQMHGATLLDAADHVIRPAILWNDGRAAAECAALEAAAPQLRAVTGNQAMPGFTAPKLRWLQRHEPGHFARVARVLLPKDWLRLQLTGDHATDVSDAAGTLWLDVARRDWDDGLLAACGLSRAHMPRLHEGSAATGRLRPAVAARFGLREVPVAAGGGDNAAGAVGVGVVRPGEAMLSLGTSGVVFVATDGFRANPGQGVHSFCHALPGTWHLMAVMLSAASCLDATARLTQSADVGALLQAAAARGLHAGTPLYLPYLNGERTPHNDPHAPAGFLGLGAETTAADLANATLEGVGFGLADGIAALEAAGGTFDGATLIGGGARSAWWAQMLADITGKALVQRAGAEVGPALGAARLARLAVDGGTLAEVCPVPPATASFVPDAARRAWHAPRQARFRALYPALRPLYGAG